MHGIPALGSVEQWVSVEHGSDCVKGREIKRAAQCIASHQTRDNPTPHPQVLQDLENQIEELGKSAHKALQ